MKFIKQGHNSDVFKPLEPTPLELFSVPSFGVFDLHRTPESESFGQGYTRVDSISPSFQTHQDAIVVHELNKGTHVMDFADIASPLPDSAPYIRYLNLQERCAIIGVDWTTVLPYVTENNALEKIGNAITTSMFKRVFLALSSIVIWPQEPKHKIPRTLFGHISIGSQEDENKDSQETVTDFSARKDRFPHFHKSVRLGTQTQDPAWGSPPAPGAGKALWRARWYYISLFSVIVWPLVPEIYALMYWFLFVKLIIICYSCLLCVLLPRRETAPFMLIYFNWE